MPPRNPNNHLDATPSIPIADLPYFPGIQGIAPLLRLLAKNPVAEVIGAEFARLA